jgi:uncharacterized protein YdeI (YjbR/CyaY-like superfamily)
MKWSAPHFDYKGMMCGMAAFKEHCAFGFWKGALVVETATGPDAAGQFGKIKTVSDLPSKKVLRDYIRKAMALNDNGTTVPRPPKAPKKAIPVPADLTAALGKNKKARATFDAFSPSHRREYLEWITEAKSGDTRKRRLDQALKWMAEGKSRNWKYQPQRAGRA